MFDVVWTTRPLKHWIVDYVRSLSMFKKSMKTMHPLVVFQFVVAILVGLAVGLGSFFLPSEWYDRGSAGAHHYRGVSRVIGGHWEYVEDLEDITSPYTFSREVCQATDGSKGDCNNPETACLPNLMNYAYIGNDGEPYPRFDVDGFRRQMRNSRIIFVGPSMIRQQVQALVWTLGHEIIDWDRSYPSKQFLNQNNCTAARKCFVDRKGNITICEQFMGSLATKIYHEGNHTLDHSKRGHGDSSCLLQDEMLADMSEFDVVFAQSVAWWTNLPKILDSPSSPSEWVSMMLPTVYYDAIGKLLSSVSQNAKTVFVLGQIGAGCQHKTAPEPFSLEGIPDRYGWAMAPKLWSTSLAVIEERGLDVQVVDAREPLMQSVHAHPAKAQDCMHFCMNSAAVNIYLDMYWTEVFSQFGALE